jgi:hypothetical protein
LGRSTTVPDNGMRAPHRYEAGRLRQGPVYPSAMQRSRFGRNPGTAYGNMDFGLGPASAPASMCSPAATSAKRWKPSQSLTVDGADELAPIIAERAAGITSLRTIAAELNARGIPTARGVGEWHSA